MYNKQGTFFCSCLLCVTVFPSDCCLLLLEVKFKVSTGDFSKLHASVESSLGAMIG